MATNLVSLVMQFLTPDMIGRIAGVLGLDRNAARPAIGAAVPSLLAALSSVAAKPGGAQKIADAAAGQTGALDGFSAMLGPANQSSLVNEGGQMLGSLLGSQNQNMLVNAISRFTGTGQGTAGSLLGMLMPVVMGTIAHAQGGARAFDPASIADLMAGQKDNIAAAMPSGLSTVLKGTGMLDALGGAATRTAAAAESDVGAASAAGGRVIAAAGRRTADATASTGNNWLWWLVPAAIAAALLIWLVPRPGLQPAQDSPRVAEQTTTVGQGTAVGALNLDQQLNDSVGGLRNILSGVTDMASAQAALPRLKDVTSQIDKITALAGQLSPEQRKALAASVDPAMTPLNQLFDKVLAIPGAGDALKPTIDALRAKLTTLAA